MSTVDVCGPAVATGDASGPSPWSRPGYVRWQSPTPNRRGHHPGVFALVNGLRKAGRLSAGEEEFWRAGVVWFDAHMLTPTAAYAQHPGATSWFTATATPCLDRIPGYLAVLDRHAVRCVEIRSEDPGTIVYADPLQVVVAARD